MNQILMGSGSPLLKHHMEIRGLGIINVKDIFGIRSVRDRKRVELVVILEEWVQNKEYDRLGLEETDLSDPRYRGPQHHGAGPAGTEYPHHR